MDANLACREELIGGKIVAMSPRPTFNHNVISDNIFTIFSTYLRRKKCRPFSDGMELFLTETDHFVPDFMVVCDRDKIKFDGVHGAPDLVVEVLSPRTQTYDKKHKKAVYEQCGVKEYWIVSPESQSIEVYVSESQKFVLQDVYTFQPWTKEVWTEGERAEAVTSFRCSLFDDLDIQLDEVFDGMLPPEKEN